MTFTILSAFNALKTFKKTIRVDSSQWKRKGLPRSTWCGTKTVFDQRKVFKSIQITTPKRKYVKAADKPPAAPKRKYVKAADKPPAAPKRKYVKAADKPPAAPKRKYVKKVPFSLLNIIEELERNMTDEPVAAIKERAMKLLTALKAE